MSECPATQKEKESNASEPHATATATPTAEKESWPELVGKDGEYAKKTIESENPKLFVHAVPLGSAVTMEFRPNRVRFYVDKNGAVRDVPTVG